MHAALPAANMAAWVHELTGTLGGGGETVTGHGIHGGKAMIATLRQLIRVPARLIHHAGQLSLRPPPGHNLLAEILARLRKLPATP
jgi:hypothetical protein